MRRISDCSSDVCSSDLRTRIFHHSCRGSRTLSLKGKGRSPPHRSRGPDKGRREANEKPDVPRKWQERRFSSMRRPYVHVVPSLCTRGMECAIWAHLPPAARVGKPHILDSGCPYAGGLDRKSTRLNSSH